jgi:hypothetical protein
VPLRTSAPVVVRVVTSFASGQRPVASGQFGQDEAMGTWQSAAALNNAEWCDLVARSHGAKTHFDSCAWTSRDRAPAHYPDAVTLARGTMVPELLSRVDATIGCSVKDSFAELDLTPYGFRTLFEADWVVRLGPLLPAPSAGPRWERIVQRHELVKWEDAWRAEDGPTELFRAELLDNASVAVLAAYQRGAVVAGAVANHSSTVVGISNVFVRPGADLDPWPGCLALASALFVDKPLVGYESGDRLAQARSNGFQDAGALRVWVNDGAAL